MTGASSWSVKKGLPGRGGYGFSPDGRRICVVEDKGAGCLRLGDRSAQRTLALYHGADQTGVGGVGRIHVRRQHRGDGPSIGAGILAAGLRWPGRAKFV